MTHEPETTQLVTAEYARSLLTGEGWSYPLRGAVAVGTDLLDNHPAYDDPNLTTAICRAQELLGDVEELAATVVELWRRLEEKGSPPGPP